MFKNKIYYALFLVLGLVYTQDPPLGFEYNQGTEQGFYFFQNLFLWKKTLWTRNIQIKIVVLRCMYPRITNIVTVT